MTGLYLGITLILCLFGISHSLTLQECAASNQPAKCYNTFENSFYSARTYGKVCQAVSEYIGCIEYVGCECNLTLSFNLALSLSYFHYYYEYLGCIPLNGPLADTKGIPCAKFGNTTGTGDGELLTLSLSVFPFVMAVEQNCTGYQACYAVYDTDAALAVHNRNQTRFCVVLDTLVTCLENVACACDGGNDTDIIYGVISEDKYFRQNCDIVRGTDIIPRIDIKCNDDGTAVTRTICHAPNPLFRCENDFATAMRSGNTLTAYCPATKAYIECAESIACECGLIYDYNIYNVTTNSIRNYNQSGCPFVTGDLTVNPGIKCPNGTGTRDDEERLLLKFSENPLLAAKYEWCPWTRKCYQDHDEREGIALFEKDYKKRCVNSKLFIECLEEAFCQCNVYYYDNATYDLNVLKYNHYTACFAEPALRDFQCNNITLADCARYDFPGMCYDTLWNTIRTSPPKNVKCEAVKTYISCAESMGCTCNLTQSFKLADSLTYIHYYYESIGCIPETGQLPDTKGIPCDRWGSNTGSTDGELLILSLSHIPYVIELDKNCTGYRACYADYDTNAALALHNRNLTVLCVVNERLVSCLETAACKCNRTNDTNIILDILSEDKFYRQTCDIDADNPIIARWDIRCQADGTSVPRTICDARPQTFLCRYEYSRTVDEFGNSLQCPATKEYMECVEGVACQCGLIRDRQTYLDLTSSIASYNRTKCVNESGAITVTPGIKCPDGSGTRQDEDRLDIELAEHPLIRINNKTCPGLNRCHDEYEETYGIALFQKNEKMLCANWRFLYECMALTLCQCGLYNANNKTDFYLESYRLSVNRACFTEQIMKDDFECKYGSIGIKCFDDSDCLTVKNTACASNGTCGCKSNSLFSTAKVECTVLDGKIGSQCRGPSDCQVVSHSQCGDGGVCSCQKGYLYSNNKCNPVSSAVKTDPVLALLTGLYVLNKAVLL